MPVALNLEPVDALFGVTVRDLDLAQIDDLTKEAISEAWIEYGLLIFPDQHLTNAQQDEFAKRFGTLEFTATALTNARRNGDLRSDPGDTLVKSLKANEGWHHDSTYLPVQAKGAVFSAEIVPDSGSTTEFADMRSAYENLAPDTAALVGDLNAFHSRRYSMERAGYQVSDTEADINSLYGFNVDDPPLRPLVKIHPDSGKPNLTIGQHAFDIPGLSETESAGLLDRLNEQSCQSTRVYSHQWSVGDTILWDNLRLMHRARPFDWTQPRRMWHTRIAGNPTTETALNYPNQ